jgi:hypothetical protein
MPLHSTGGTVRPEGTFGLLRYLLGGRRPSETARQALSPTPIQGCRLEPQQDKGGISLAAPPELAPRLHSLPPILHMPCQSPTPGCSKGPRGLSVPPRVTSIFTGTETSPGPPLRQWPSRYAIHAGHNLRDKELRSPLSTVFTVGWAISSAWPTAHFREALNYFPLYLHQG